MQLGLQIPQQSASVGGIMSVRPLSALLEQDRQQARAEDGRNDVVIQSLAAQIRKHWELAKYAKRETEQLMLRALRSMRGEYDPDKLQRLKDQNSSEIYMMLFATKARQFKALLSDVLMGSGDDKPWSLKATPAPELPPDIVASILKGVAELVMQAEQSPTPLSVDQIRQLMRDAKTQAEASTDEEARARSKRAETKLEDLLVEGGFYEALDQFLDDLAVFKTAFIKGPVMRRVGTLSWQPGQDGTYRPIATEAIKPHWERVDPLNVYPSPHSRTINDGYLIERHRLTPQALSEMIGVEGYSEDAIRRVLDLHGINGLHDWLAVDTERARAEGRTTLPLEQSSDLIDTLQYWGSATGKLLREWGMTPEEVPDEAKTYEVEAWLVGTDVIKAVINADPLARRPYFTDSFKRQPGAFWGVSLFDTMCDCQDMCNAAARALSNNLGIASGPQVWVNIDRLPPGEDITALYPWKITQTITDPAGSSAAPMGFFQPTSNANELMTVFERFSQLADEYTGIPRYMAGIDGANGAGRTASGMSMMIGNANKTVKDRLASLDFRVIEPVCRSGYEYIMRYVGDPDLKGDLNIEARGALSLVTKDAAQVRRNEFLTVALQSPVVQEIIGVPGIAELLRSTAKTLDLDSSDIVPSDTQLKTQLAQRAQQMLAQQAAAGQAAPQGHSSKKQLDNGAPVTDNYGA